MIRTEDIENIHLFCELHEVVLFNSNTGFFIVTCNKEIIFSLQTPEMIKFSLYFALICHNHEIMRK